MPKTDLIEALDKIKKLCDEAKLQINNPDQLNSSINEIISIANTISSNKPQIPDLSGKKVLLVEDDSVNIMVAEAFLKKTNCSVDTAQNGLEALDKYKKSLKNNDFYALIFMDMQMPVMDGITAVKNIRKLEEMSEKHIPIIAMTGNILDSDIKKAEISGIDDYILKPISAKILYEKVSGLLGISDFFEKKEVPFEKKQVSGKQKLNEFPDFSNKKILIVDDNKLNVEIINLMVKKTGASFTDAYDGQEALDKFFSSEENHFDIVLMDIQMPVMDGYTCAEKIRNSNRKDKDIPIIAISANAFQEDIEKSMAAGINFHLSKPVNMKQLHEKMKSFL